jgi:hypothetical protein
MTDRHTPPSPGIEPHEDAAVEATQVIATTDTTDTIQLPTRASAHAATHERAAAENARTKAHHKAARFWYKEKRFALPLAVLAAFTVIMLTTGGNDSGLFRAVTSAAQPTAAIGLKAPPATATIGQSVRDGRFAFIVTGLQPPTKSITDRSGRTQTAQGVFVLVRLNVTNIGYESRSLHATDQFLIDTEGNRFATSSAISSMVGAETLFLQEINPGHTVNNAPVLFDVAPGTVVASIELHDSMNSTGVQVRLP